MADSPLTQRGAALSELCDVMDRLLAPDGCPWDREQTLETLKPFLLEETHEVLEAMDGAPEHHCDELGDLMMQIVFQAALRARAGAFGIDDVSRAITAKLVRRHPHVFGDKKLSDSAQVLDQWAQLKEKEKAAQGKKQRTLDGLPRALPALLRAQRTQEKASSVGFDWPDANGPREKIAEELQELDEARAAGAHDRMQAEIGDLLFAVVNFARKLGLDAEMALAATVERFRKRFQHVEDGLAARGKTPREATLAEMDALWDAAKASLRGDDRSA